MSCTLHYHHHHPSAKAYHHGDVSPQRTGDDVGVVALGGKGGSYRTVQRFYNTVLPWPLLFWWFFRTQQYWGLDDFMNVKPTPVTNAANLALFMVNVAQRLLLDLHVQQPHASVLDLKALFRGHKYVTETLKLLPEMPEPVLLRRIYARITVLGCIHQPEPVLDAP